MKTNAREDTCDIVFDDINDAERIINALECSELITRSGHKYWIKNENIRFKIYDRSFRWHIDTKYTDLDSLEFACRISKLCPDIKFMFYITRWTVFGSILFISFDIKNGNLIYNNKEYTARIDCIPGMWVKDESDETKKICIPGRPEFIVRNEDCSIDLDCNASSYGSYMIYMNDKEFANAINLYIEDQLYDSDSDYKKSLRTACKSEVCVP